MMSEFNTIECNRMSEFNTIQCNRMKSEFNTKKSTFASSQSTQIHYVEERRAVELAEHKSMHSF